MAEPNGEPTARGLGEAQLAESPGPSVAEQSGKGELGARDRGQRPAQAPAAAQTTHLVFWQAQQIQSSSFFW